MPVTRDKPAPYAPAKTILEVIYRHRSRGLPLPVIGETLERISVPSTLLPRVLQSLEALDLIDEDGKPTPTFEAIRLAPENEYKKRLEDWLKGTYADIFSFVDPTKDDETRIRDAFRSYNPVGQQPRMVTLFVGLCTEAGLIVPKQPASAPRSRPAVEPARRSSPARPKPPRHAEQNGSIPGLPAPLAGLLASLPRDGDGWTTEKRTKFMTAFGTVLDLCVPIVDDADADADEAA